MKLTTVDFYPRRNPVPQDLITDYDFNHAEGETELDFAKRRYMELCRENKKQFSELCNQAMEIDQLRRRIDNMKGQIETIRDLYFSLRHLSELMGAQE